MGDTAIAITNLNDLPKVFTLVDVLGNKLGTLANPLNLVLQVAGANISANNPLPITDTGQGIALVSQSSSIVAAAAGTCILPASATKTTYIRGIIITSAAAAAVVSGVVTLTGPTNVLSFTYEMLVANQSVLTLYFGEDGIPGTAINTALTVNFPAVTGGSATTIVAWGYQL